MGFREKIAQLATGKTLLERKQEKAAMQVIRQEARAAALQEKRKQVVKLAAEKEKVKYEREIKRLREPKQSFFGRANYGSPFGQPRSLGTKKAGKPIDLLGFDFAPPTKKYKVIWKRRKWKEVKDKKW